MVDKALGFVFYPICRQQKGSLHKTPTGKFHLQIHTIERVIELELTESLEKNAVASLPR